MVKTNKEFEIVGSSDADMNMRKNLGLFQGNITFDEKYKRVVQEYQNNKDQIDFFNLLKEIRSTNNLKIKNKKRK